MAKNERTTTGKYPVDDYLTMLRLAKRSDKTIEGYHKVLKGYADFIGVPLSEIHRHLLVSNLLKYAGSRKGKSDAGTKTNLSILRRYFTVNGVKFDEMEFNAVKPKVVREHNDKPLDLETLQKMMDLTDVHGRAIISFLISTGCRAGETSEILLSDVKGDVVTIRNEIAKGGHGGKVYLTSEAREYLDLWLKERDEYIRIADARMKGLTGKNNPHPSAPRPKNDQRLFGISYNSMHRIFSRLYDKVDGEQGKYHAQCTIHSTRKYFRTLAAQAMHPDLVTGLMRQTGYLDSTYVRMTNEEKYQQFKKGESALYITRKDRRIQDGEMSDLERENLELRKRLESLEEQSTPREREMLEEDRSEFNKMWNEITALKAALREKSELRNEDNWKESDLK